MEVPGSAAGFRAHWQWPLREAGAVRCQAASADLAGLDVGAVIPASGRQLRAAARPRWSLSPASTCGSRGAWRGPMGCATGPLAGVSWRSRWSVKGARRLAGLAVVFHIGRQRAGCVLRVLDARIGGGVHGAMAGEGGVVEPVGVGHVRDVRRERLAHLWRAGNRRGVLGGGFPLQGNGAANYGGGVARRVGVALGLVRPGDEQQWERRWPPGGNHGPPHALTGPKVGGGGGLRPARPQRRSRYGAFLAAWKYFLSPAARPRRRTPR